MSSTSQPVASLADLAVITEVIRNVSIGNVEQAKTITGEIKDVLLRNSPAYKDYIAEMSERMSFMDANVDTTEGIAAAEERIAKDKARAIATAQREVAEEVVKDLNAIATGKKSVLDMTLAGLIHGMSKWAADLFVLIPHLAKPNGTREDNITMLKNWLKLDNNLFFLALWLIIIVVIVVII